MQDKEKSSYSSFLQYSGMALEFFILCAIGAFAGNWLDSKLVIGFPIFTIILLLIGMSGALWSIYKQTTKKS